MGWGRWWNYVKRGVEHDSDHLAVYELGDKDRNTVYYGSGKLRTRLLSHLNKEECPLARHYRFEIFPTEEECREREEALLKAYEDKHKKLPMYNERIG